MGVLSRDVAATLGRGPACHDGRGRVRGQRHRLDEVRITFNWSMRLNTE